MGYSRSVDTDVPSVADLFRGQTARAVHLHVRYVYTLIVHVESIQSKRTVSGRLAKASSSTMKTPSFRTRICMLS